MPVKTLVALTAVIVGVVAIGGASGSTSIKIFHATIEQTSASTFKFTLTNVDASNQAFGSANIEVPTEFSNPSGFVQTVAGGTKQWKTPVLNTSVNPRRIELRSLDSKNALAPDQSLTVVFSSTAPCSAASYKWRTYVKQSNTFLGTGNDFTGNTPSVSVVGALDAFLIAPEIGDPQVVDRPIGVSVEAQDACGNRVTGYQGPASVSGLTGVSSSLSFTNGLASTSLTPLQTQVDARITVADGLVSNSSNDFDVVTKYCTSDDEEEICEASDANKKTIVTTPRPPTGATMAISFTAFAPTGLTCAGAGTITGRGSLAQIEPTDYPSTTLIPLTIRWDKSAAPGTGVANFVFCWSKDGTSFKVAQSCTKTGGLPGEEKLCELKRSRNGVGDLVIDVLIHPDDPWGGLG